MLESDVRDAGVWLAQADSDVRTAKGLQTSPPPPMRPEDVGCHLAALCSQALEKSIKGYFLLCGMTPGTTHRADKYIVALMRKGVLRYGDHYQTVSGLFDTATRGVVGRLITLTPGTLGRKDVPNTEYPWGSHGSLMAPVGAVYFSSQSEQGIWVQTAARVVSTLRKLHSAASRTPMR